MPCVCESTKRSYPPWLWRVRTYLKRSVILAIVVAYFLLATSLASIYFWRYPNESSRGLPQLRGSYNKRPFTGYAQSLAVPAARVASVAGKPEIWARSPFQIAATADLRGVLGVDATQELRSLCGRCLYRTLTSYVRVKDHGRFAVVLTGDIPAMWIRDSAVQMASYIPWVARRPALRHTLEGAIRAQSFFILQVGAAEVQL